MIPARAWVLQGGRSEISGPFVVAGIVNVTPDSFSDGGKYAETGAAARHARLLVEQGAGIVDIGGESTRPGAEAIRPGEELLRVLPVVRDVVAMRDAARNAAFHVSVDTWRAATATAALDAGADIVNDISGGTFDPAMAAVLGERKPGYVLTHCPAPPRTMQRHAAYADVTAEVLAFFEARMNALVRAGLPESHMVLDPGIGFGKTGEHNLALLRAIERLQSLGRPLYIGISRKSFLGALPGGDAGNRDASTQVLTALMAARGVMVHRVHDVAGAVAALRLVTLLDEDRGTYADSRI